MTEEKEIEEMEEVCEFCGGTGEVETDIFDEDSHQYQPVGIKECICQLRENDDE